MAQSNNQPQDRGIAVQAAERRGLIRFLHMICRIYARGYHRVELPRPIVLPRRGAGILVCNHISALDPLLLQGVIERPIIWLIAREYYELWGLRQGFGLLEAIPVDRAGHDTAAMRSALRALHRGRLVGLFPEGRIATSRQILGFQNGAALLAIKSAAPVYPFYLEGTQRGYEMLASLVVPQEAVLRCGAALNFAAGFGARMDVAAASRQIQAAIAALIPRRA